MTAYTPGRTYTREFVETAVRRAIEATEGPEQLTLVAVSRELGIPVSTLHKWTRDRHPETLRPQPRRRIPADPAGEPRTKAGADSTGDMADINAGATCCRNHAQLAHENAILRAALVLLARDILLTTPQ